MRIPLWSKLRLFFGILWREWEPRSCGIPDEYRAHYRITLADAIRIAFKWEVNK